MADVCVREKDVCVREKHAVRRPPTCQLMDLRG